MEAEAVAQRAVAGELSFFLFRFLIVSNRLFSFFFEESMTMDVQ